MGARACLKTHMEGKLRTTTACGCFSDYTVTTHRQTPCFVKRAVPDAERTQRGAFTRHPPSYPRLHGPETPHCLLNFLLGNLVYEQAWAQALRLYWSQVRGGPAGQRAGQCQCPSPGPCRGVWSPPTGPHSGWGDACRAETGRGGGRWPCRLGLTWIPGYSLLLRKG